MRMLNRTIAASACLVATIFLSVASGQDARTGIDEKDPAYQSAERAHSELWRRFVTEHGIILDYVTPQGKVIIPTPQECEACKPNGLAWWCSTENGAFFSGLYLAGLCGRWQVRGRNDEDAQSARQIARGLMLLSRVGATPGFIARGVATDGHSHHPAGSDDQTLPWFYGLYQYVKSGIPAQSERDDIVRQMVDVATALEGNQWQMPCDPAPYGNRSSFSGKSPVSVPRLLFVTRAMYDLTGDERWKRAYEMLRDQKPDDSDKTRLEICSDGTLVAEHTRPESGYYAFWTKASCQACLRTLRDLSVTQKERDHYNAGLQIYARAAAEHIDDFRGFSIDKMPAFNHDWRLLDQWWRPQKSVADFLAVAGAQSKHWHGSISPAKGYEARYVREPLFAAWIVLLSGDTDLIAAAGDEIRAAIVHFDWRQLNYSTFFPAECVYYEAVRYGL